MEPTGDVYLLARAMLLGGAVRRKLEPEVAGVTLPRGPDSLRKLAGWRQLQTAHDLQDLRCVLAKLNVHALHAYRAAGVDDDEAHLSDTGHHAHRLIALRQHVVLACPGELSVEQDRQTNVCCLLQAHGSLGRIAVDHIRVRLLAERVG